MTWAQLAELWYERDARYRLRRFVPLTTRDRDAIVFYRRMEVALVVASDRPLAAASLGSWTIPKGLA